MTTEVNTGKKLKLIETDDINKISFEAGQYIIVDNAMVYYDPTTGVSINDRVCLTPKNEVDIYVRERNNTDAYYLALHTRPINGDIVIIKDLIPNTTDKFIYHIYLYNNNTEDTNTDDWVKINDSYNAKNVYFDSDITITTDIPGVGLINGRKQINSTGKNIIEVLDEILAPEKYPNIVKPSFNLILNEAGNYMPNTKITPTYSIEVNPGSYEFGPETGIEITNCRVVSSNGSSKSTSSGSFSQITINEDTDFYITASINYNSGNIPLTAKGNNYPDGQIKAATVSITSEHIIGYRNGVYYGTFNEKFTTITFTDSLLDSLNRSNKNFQSNDKYSMIVPQNTQSIIIIFDLGDSGSTNDLKVINNTANCDMTGAFETKSITINNRPYMLMIYNPASPYEITADLELILY